MRHRGVTHTTRIWSVGVPLIALAATAVWLAGCDKVPKFGDLVGQEKKAEEPPAAEPEPAPQAVVTPPVQPEIKPEPPQEPVKPTPEEAMADFENSTTTAHSDAELAELAENMGEQRDRLAKMDMAGSKLTDKGAIEIGKFPAVTYLDVSGSLITGGGLTYLESLTSLEVLSLAGTRVESEGLSHIAGLINLRELDISRTMVGIEGLQHIAKLVNLEKLCFNDTSISGQGFVSWSKGGKFSNLRHIEAKNSQFGNGMNFIKNMQNLEYLDAGQSGVSDVSLQRLDKSNNLKVLLLGFNQISDQGLFHLKRCRALEDVSLRQNKAIRGPGLEAFINCKGLKTIDLSGTSAGNNFVQELQKHVPGLQAQL